MTPEDMEDMRKRRLDTRLFESQPYEMAFPTPRLMRTAQYYRVIVLFFQCFALIPPVISAYEIEPSQPSIMYLLLILTAAYWFLCIARLGFSKTNVSGPNWWWIQIVGGVCEIVLIGLLGSVYCRYRIQSGEYWFALFILPLFRLSEIGEALGWTLGSALVAIMLGLAYSPEITIPIFYVAYDAYQFWYMTWFGQLLLIVLAAFVPFYIVRLLDLSREAARFWWHRNTGFTTDHPTEYDQSEIMKLTFHEGLDSLVAADWGALWLLNNMNTVARGGLRQVFRFEREIHHVSWIRQWIFRRRHGTTHKGSEEISEETSSNLLRELHNKKGIVSSNLGNRPDLEFQTRHEQPDLQFRIAIPVQIDKISLPIGFLEVGTGWPVTGHLRSAFEKRARALASSIGEIARHARALKAENMKSGLSQLEHTASDEPELYSRAIELLSAYFSKPVVMFQYSPHTKRMLTVVGQIQSQQVNEFQQRLESQSLSLYQSGEIIVCPASSVSANRTINGCHYICPLVCRETSVELLVILDHASALSEIDRAVLRECAFIITAMVLRWRAANLPRSTPVSSRKLFYDSHESLERLARHVKDQSGADIVVLYEFEEGLPKIPPIIVGELNKPEYLQSKPIVIEGQNPILEIARAREPRFNEDIRSTSYGHGKNRHGDAVFAEREEIASSIGLPLVTPQGTVGVMWFNFRAPKKFSPPEKEYYYELSRSASKFIKSKRELEIMQYIQGQKYRAHFHAELHDGLVHDIYHLSGYVEAAKSWIDSKQPEKAREQLATIETYIKQIDKSLRQLLVDPLEPWEISPSRFNLSERIRNLQSILQQNHAGLPKDIEIEGEDIIPTMLQEQLFHVMQEAIRNAVRHGRADRISIRVEHKDQSLLLTISNNGRGFDVTTLNSGVGIRAMKTRAKVIGGKIKIDSEPHSGTTIVLEVPIEDVEEENNDNL